MLISYCSSHVPWAIFDFVETLFTFLKEQSDKYLLILFKKFEVPSASLNSFDGQTVGCVHVSRQCFWGNGILGSRTFTQNTRASKYLNPKERLTKKQEGNS